MADTSKPELIVCLNGTQEMEFEDKVFDERQNIVEYVLSLADVNKRVWYNGFRKAI